MVADTDATADGGFFFAVALPVSLANAREGGLIAESFVDGQVGEVGTVLDDTASG